MNPHLEFVRNNLTRRARLLAAARAWFRTAGYLEVDTPVRVRAPAPEVNIDAEPSGRAWLRTSPELHMKRMLAAGYGQIVQIGPCFRQGERGARHRPEFTMIEWYRAHAGAQDILADTTALLVALATELAGGTVLSYRGRMLDWAPPWHIVSVRDAFVRAAGWDPLADYDARRFELDWIEKVEPALARCDRPVVLKDFPAPAAALARLQPDNPRAADRWELYIAGLELANAYGELTDPDEQQRRFEDWNRERQGLGKTAYPADADFFAALRDGLPPCGGIALGFDRLAMLFCDAADIRDVLPFPEETAGL